MKSTTIKNKPYVNFIQLDKKPKIKEAIDIIIEDFMYKEKAITENRYKSFIKKYKFSNKDTNLFRGHVEHFLNRDLIN